MAVEYDDVDVWFAPGPSARSYLVRARSGTDEAHGVFELSVQHDVLERSVQQLTRSTRPTAGGRDIGASPSDEILDPQRLGGALADALLAGAVGALYDRAFGRAQAAGRGTRLRLCFDEAAELLDVPWELLYRAPTFVASQRLTPVVRVLRPSRQLASTPLTGPVRILGVVASPNDLTPLSTAGERERVDAAIAAMRAAGVVDLNWLEPATVRRLRQALQERPYHVLHFIGHGSFEDGDAAIYLEADDGGHVAVTETVLANLLADQVHLRLVVLNACEGARTSLRDPMTGVATALVGLGVPAVVAMQFPVSDRAAVAFAEEFYRALIDRRLGVDEAVAEARKAILAEVSDVEWATPVLFLGATGAEPARGRLLAPRVAEPDVPPPPGPEPGVAPALATRAAPPPAPPVGGSPLRTRRRWYAAAAGIAALTALIAAVAARSGGGSDDPTSRSPSSIANTEPSGGPRSGIASREVAAEVEWRGLTIQSFDVVHDLDDDTLVWSALWTNYSSEPAVVSVADEIQLVFGESTYHPELSSERVAAYSGETMQFVFREIPDDIDLDRAYLWLGRPTEHQALIPLRADDTVYFEPSRRAGVGASLELAGGAIFTVESVLAVPARCGAPFSGAPVSTWAYVVSGTVVKSTTATVTFGEQRIIRPNGSLRGISAPTPAIGGVFNGPIRMCFTEDVGFVPDTFTLAIDTSADGGPTQTARLEIEVPARAVTVPPPPTTVPGIALTGTPPCPAVDGSSPRAVTFDTPPGLCLEARKYTATIVTTRGTFMLELDATDAPVAVNNFVVLARYHFFDGTPCHQALRFKYVTCGDPTGTGDGGPGYSLTMSDTEAFPDGRQVVLVTNFSGDEAGSRFAIVLADDVLGAPQGAPFAKVLDDATSLATLAAINAAATRNAAHLGIPPDEPITIESVTITAQS